MIIIIFTTGGIVNKYECTNGSGTTSRLMPAASRSDSNVNCQRASSWAVQARSQLMFTDGRRPFAMLYVQYMHMHVHILKVGLCRNIKNPYPSIDAYLREEQSCHCHRGPIWNDWAAGFRLVEAFPNDPNKTGRTTTTTTTTRWLPIWHQFLI